MGDLDEGHEGGHGGVGGLAVGGVLVQGQVAHDARRIVLRLHQVVCPATEPPAAPLLRSACDGWPAEAHLCGEPLSSHREPPL